MVTTIPTKQAQNNISVLNMFFVPDASDAVPQTSKSSSTAVEPDQSIDEILGLEVLKHLTELYLFL